MKKIILFLMFLPISLIAQNSNKIDSLKIELKKAKHDTLKVQVLKGLFWQYYHSGPEIAKDYATKAVELSLKIKYTIGIWDGYNNFGILNYSSGKYDSALYWFNKAIKLGDKNKYENQYIYSINYAGHSYHLQSQFEKSDSCFLLLLAFAETTGNKANMAKGHKALAINSYTVGDYQTAIHHYLKADNLLGDVLSIDKGEILQNIGLTYLVIDNFKAGLYYYDLALKVYEAMNDEYGINAIQMSLAQVDIDQKDYHKAEERLLTSFSYFNKANDPIMLGEIQYLLGKVNFSINQYSNAKKYYNDAIETLKDSHGSVSLNHAYRGLGEVYTKLNDINKAISLYEKAYENSIKIGEIQSIASILNSQSELYFKTNNFKKAYELQKEGQVFSDSLNNIKSSKVLHELEAQYQNEKNRNQIALLEAQSELKVQEQANQRNIFIASLLGAIILLGVFYFLLVNNRKAHRKLKELDALKSRFFANISHEFRTPLTLISGPIEQKLKNDALEDHDKADFEMINRNSKQLLNLVDQLLDLSKIESGGYQVKIEKIDTAEQLKALASSFEYAAKQKGISYKVSISPSSTETWFDKDALQKITLNILSNALKFTPEKGFINFTAEINAGKLVMVCENSGAGISFKDQQKIFERFYQQNGEAGGAGIGLALVKELADLLNGKITMKSIPEVLTTFRVTLPVEKDAFPKKFITKSTHPTPVISEKFSVEIENREPSFEDAHNEEQPILLIVEDNKDIIRFIKSLFHKEYKILEANDGKKGIETAIKHIPDIIISDIMMPGTDGIELCRTLKTDERTSHIPIILLTAKAGDEDKLLGFETGADDYITKPFNSEVLKIRIEKLIEIRKNLQERFSQEVVLKPKEIALTSADQKFLEKVQHILDDKLTDSDFTAESFSKELGMSRMQLHRKLTGLTGLSANHFIRAYRIKMASALLANPGTNISEVGYMVGFNNPSHFAKCFKEQFKCTPSEFVQRMKVNTTDQSL